MTVYRGFVADTPDDPFTGAPLRAETDVALLVRDGVIVERGSAATVLADNPGEDVVDLEGGVLVPGMVDTHVHLPQVRAIGGLGMPLLDWLEHRALPEEARLADDAYAKGVATDFLDGLARAGTTSALVFGAHFSGAVDELFAQADASGLRITSGLVVSDRMLRDDLHTTPERAYAESVELARRWHGHGRLRYAVTPRFALSTTREMLDACEQVVRDVEGSGSPRTSTRTPARSRRSTSCSARATTTTSTATTSTVCWGSARCSRTTCTRPTASCSGWPPPAP
ncbi:hypothetical protein GCM10025872_01450 [Barrientosiimonas endolithica]|uniref:Amidohydrolase-related domain-containing protein n=1 Tax=Barrientosiimonas endolithica TaxID=1535208 RepID=A0ABN6YGV6_9MICO|nr:hypothetical protein GCM10025872_01450 [Barrientosiimonas endolithica]